MHSRIVLLTYFHACICSQQLNAPGNQSTWQKQSSQLFGVYAVQNLTQDVFCLIFLIKVTPIRQTTTVTLIGEREYVAGKSVRLAR